MSTHRPASGHRLYPTYCYRASPTFNVWVKLTAADVHALRSEPAFPGQHIYFYLNHPIRYVRLVGVVVAVDDINIKYTVLTVDDGSGATVEVKLVRFTPDVYNAVESPSNTAVDNVNVFSRLGLFKVMVDRHEVDIGTVVKIKCTISEFREQKQLELKRVWIVPTTNDEAMAWADTAAFKREVLSRPWRISSAEHKAIRAEINAEKRKAQAHEKLRIEREAAKREHRKAQEENLVKREAKLEARRRKEEVMMNAGALI